MPKPFFEKIVFLEGVGKNFLEHEYFEKWHEYICKEYSPPKRPIALFIPCYWGKPYDQSYIFKEIEKNVLNILKPDEVHFIVISSAGVVPREFWHETVFKAYDWDPNFETEEIKEQYVKVTTQRLKNYFQAYKENYKIFASYLRLNSESFKSLQQAIKDFNIHLYFSPTIETQAELQQIKFEDVDLLLIQPEALQDLNEMLSELKNKLTLL